MTTSNRFSTASARILLAGGIVASSVFAMGLPSFAHAATYAFVNTSREVSIVNADNWMEAIANAYNIDSHSGVLLLTSLNSNIIGTHI